MKKQIVFEEEEFKRIMLDFVNNFIKHSKEGYGVKLICNSTKKILTNRNEICGAFLLPWYDTFGNNQCK